MALSVSKGPSTSAGGVTTSVICLRATLARSLFLALCFVCWLSQLRMSFMNLSTSARISSLNCALCFLSGLKWNNTTALSWLAMFSCCPLEISLAIVLYRHTSFVSCLVSSSSSGGIIPSTRESTLSISSFTDALSRVGGTQSCWRLSLATKLMIDSFANLWTKKALILLPTLLQQEVWADFASDSSLSSSSMALIISAAASLVSLEVLDASRSYSSFEISSLYSMPLISLDCSSRIFFTASVVVTTKLFSEEISSSSQDSPVLPMLSCSVDVSSGVLSSAASSFGLCNSSSLYLRVIVARFFMIFTSFLTIILSLLVKVLEAMLALPLSV